MTTCTRRIEFDAAHRVLRHESKCAHLHGHRYAVLVTCRGPLDSVGRVIDFGVVKEVVGGWVDSAMDHGTLVNAEDAELLAWLRANGQKHLVFDCEPTAENIAALVMRESQERLRSTGVVVVGVTVYETPNCSAEVVA